MNINNLYKNGIECEVCNDKFINTDDIENILKRGMCCFCFEIEQKKRSKKKRLSNIIKILRNVTQPSSKY